MSALGLRSPRSIWLRYGLETPAASASWRTDFPACSRCCLMYSPMLLMPPMVPILLADASVELALERSCQGNCRQVIAGKRKGLRQVRQPALAAHAPGVDFGDDHSLVAARGQPAQQLSAWLLATARHEGLIGDQALLRPSIAVSSVDVRQPAAKGVDHGDGVRAGG